jgi:hypothetical protein
MIAKAFFMAKDPYRGGASNFRDHRIDRDYRLVNPLAIRPVHKP